MARPNTAKRAKKAQTITEISLEDFVRGWEVLVGEPPAIMLDDRRDMISILVETTEVAAAYKSPAPASVGAPAGGSRARSD